MFKEERRHAIINLLIKDNSVSVSKLSDLYKVSQRLFVPIYAISRNQVCFSVAMAEDFKP